MANSVTHPVTGASMEYQQLIIGPVTKDAWPLSPFVVLMNPGNFLAVGHAGTSHEIADALRLPTEKLRQHTEHNMLMQALRKLIIEHVEEKYIKHLRHKNIHYNAHTPSAMLKYLFDNYG
jgi:hypothetical protein